jgi:hypothetical protein
MTQDEYEQALREKAKALYRHLMGDPFKVPLLDPRNRDIYPEEIIQEQHLQFWLETVESLQVINVDPT